MSSGRNLKMSEFTYMKKAFLKHWVIILSVLTFSAILCSIMQNRYSIDQIGVLVLLFMLVTNFIFALFYALLQTKLASPFKQTMLFASMLALMQILLSYAYHHLHVDWGAVADGSDQLTYYQKFVHGQLTYWGIYLLPFIFSMAIFLSRQIKRNPL